MNDCLVSFYSDHGCVETIRFYGCQDEDEALSRLRTARGNAAAERVVQILILAIAEPINPADRAAFIRAEVEAMDWPEVIDG